MAALVYLKRRREPGPGPAPSSDVVPIRREEWLAIVARDPALVPRPEIGRGCAEWTAGGPGEEDSEARAGGGRAAGPRPRRLVFYREGALAVSAGDRGLAAKLVEIAGELGPGGAGGEGGLYLGMSAPRLDDCGPIPHAGLGLLLGLVRGRLRGNSPGS